MLARLTALEVIRRPVSLLLLLAAVCLAVLGPVLNLHRFGEDGKLARDGAFALHAALGMLLAGYAAGLTLAAERRRGTLETALAAPVGRGVFFLARYAGIAGALLVFSFCCTLATLLAERIAERFVEGPAAWGWILDGATAGRTLALVGAALLLAAWLNYRRGQPFESWAARLLPAALLAALVLSACFDRQGAWAPFAWRVAWRLVPVSLLLAMALLVLAAIALAVSVYAGPAATMAVTVIVFCAGLASDYALARAHGAWRAVLALAPNWQLFWLVDSLNNGGRVPVACLLRTALYTGLQCAGWLLLGMAAFFRADIGRRE